MTVQELLSKVSYGSLLGYDIVFRVPGGGDYSNMDLEVMDVAIDDEHRQIILES